MTTNTSAPVLSATDLHRHHGRGRARFEAVRGIDLTVHRGELFALLGTNGAGKTSTLEVLEGLAPASQGRAEVFGRDPYRERRHVVGRIGIMLQQAGFSDDLTVTETARMWHSTLSAPRAVVDVLADVDLARRAEVKVKSLSGGEKRRLDLGLALMGRPELLFLDEPTTGLDPQSRHLTWDLVRSLLDEGTTVVLTTHYLAEAEELASRIAIMDRGLIHSEGTVADLIATQNARIGFECDRPELLRLGELPALVGAPSHAGGRVVLETRELQATLQSLLLAADRERVQLRRLDARSATLEQAFMAIAEQGSERADALPGAAVPAA